MPRPILMHARGESSTPVASHRVRCRGRRDARRILPIACA